MKWFGKSWEGPNKRAEEVGIPVGVSCDLCRRRFSKEDQGVIALQEDHGWIDPFPGLPDDPPELVYHWVCWYRGLSRNSKGKCSHPMMCYTTRQAGRRRQFQCGLCGIDIEGEFS